MKKIRLILTYQCGDCAKEDKRIEILISPMKSVDMVKQQTMLLIGVLLAMLTDVFSDNKGGMMSHQMAMISIKVGYETDVSIIYKKDCIIPCSGQEHLLWLQKIGDTVKIPLSNFLLDVELRSKEGTRP